MNTRPKIYGPARCKSATGPVSDEKYPRKENCEKMLILENSTPCLFLKWDSVECSVKLSSLNRIRRITEFITRRWVQWRKSHENKKLFTANGKSKTFLGHRIEFLSAKRLVRTTSRRKRKEFDFLSSRESSQYLISTWHPRPRHVWRREKQRKKTLTTNSINKLRNNNNQWLQLIRARQNWSDTNSEIYEARCLELHLEERKKVSQSSSILLLRPRR